MKRQNAYFQALKEKEDEARKEIDTHDAPQSPISILPDLKTEDKRRFKKTTCYFSDPQLVKFDDIAYGVKKKSGKKISLPEIARFLIETCNSEDLIDRMTARR